VSNVATAVTVIPVDGGGRAGGRDFARSFLRRSSRDAVAAAESVVAAGRNSIAAAGGAARSVGRSVGDRM